MLLIRQWVKTMFKERADGDRATARRIRRRHRLDRISFCHLLMPRVGNDGILVPRLGYKYRFCRLLEEVYDRSASQTHRLRGNSYFEGLRTLRLIKRRQVEENFKLL